MILRHQQAQQITTEAAGRGTRMHKWIEDYIKNGFIGEPGSNPYSIQSHKMAKSIIDKGLINCEEFWGTEVSLYFPKIYAGTTDLIGVHQGSPAIMDHKQTNKLKKREWIDDYFSQLVFYGTAHNEVYQTNIKKGVIFMCTADNVYQEFILEGGEWEIYESKMWDRIEKYLDNSLEALMDLKTGITVYFINSEEVELNVIAETHICMYIILNTLGMQLAFEKDILDKK